MGNRRSANNRRANIKRNRTEGEARGGCGCRDNDTAGRETAPSCSRYCSNVCRRLFPLDFTRCFNDCVSCQEDVLFETDHEFYED
ncbi:hypothetical protein [Guptibacillus sedimenti]|uniref:hypothetical protein n=1 Tax=Guptibacillus sedimenti TaxID=3025680 RepID=UPI002362FD35|nr:hypothetical protein [Pseudalkalibacillus sedimenti]